jgi:CHAT domain
MPQTTILILAANPKGTTTLRLDQEVRDITEGLQRATQRETFKLESRWAVRPRDIQRALLDLNPQIVHFSGHGTGDDGLAFEDTNGNITIASTDSLATLFSLFTSVQCVVLNACYSAIQAEAIAQHIPHVIGMNQPIGDKAAIEFSVSFYDALGAGRDVPFAYQIAKNAIQLAGIPEDLTPVLHSCPTLATESSTQSSISIPKTTLTAGQRRRLEQQRDTLQAEWDLRREKLQKLRDSEAIEAGTAIKFQLTKQIEAEEEKLKGLERELDLREQELMA